MKAREGGILRVTLYSWEWVFLFISYRNWKTTIAIGFFSMTWEEGINYSMRGAWTRSFLSPYSSRRDRVGEGGGKL